MEDFYTDEPIDWQQVEDDYGRSMPDGTDSVHSWDYFAPEDDDDLHSSSRWDFSAGVFSDVVAVGAPEKIRRLVEMIRKQPWQITRAKSFYEQALFMADYEDSAEIVEYMNYFPTYRDMTVAQMRSYFTIRKMWRQGKFPDVSLSYIFVYVYEILMQVGIGKPEEGLEILKELLAAYSPSVPKLCRYLNPWMRDYVVYYNLEDYFNEVFAKENEQDALAATIANYDNADGKTLLDAVCALSRYDIRKSLLFKRLPDKAVNCTIEVLRAIVPQIEQQSHHRIETFCFGKKTRRQITMFANAVFYDPKPVKSAETFVAPRHRYFCRGGLWSKDEYIVNQQQVAKVLGAILHEADCQQRVAFGIKPKLQTKDVAGPYRQAIHEAIATWITKEKKAEAAREAERRRVSIDFSKLGKIRSDAEVVMEKLETQADEEEEAFSNETVVDSQPEKKTAAKTDENPERTFLRLLLSGGDWRQYLRDIHVPEGVMVENINNNAMDEIGDIMLEDNGNGLHVIEDYREDVEKMIGEDGK